MEQNESVNPIYTRLTDIINTLGALRKTFSNSEKVKKIRRSLPKEWRPKKIAIKEANDTLFIDDLISSFISYEKDLTTEKYNEDEKKKSFSLKASRSKSDNESEIENEDMAMIAGKFKIIFKKSIERRKFKN